MNDPVDIIYEDTDLIVCRKPAGVPVQSAKIGQKDMVSILNNYLAELQTGQKRTQPVYIVHRLDQPVEGILVFAKTKRAAADLSRQVSDGSMEKVYQAVCCVMREHSGTDSGYHGDCNYHGDCTEDCAEKNISDADNQEMSNASDYRIGDKYCLIDYLMKDGRTNTSSVVSRDNRDAKRAELVFQVLKVRERSVSSQDSCSFRKIRYLLTEIHLKTGRHHQIRVQMAHAGLPLYGDQKYNEMWRAFLTESGSANPDNDSDLPDSGKGRNTFPALCAVSLAFTHPFSKKKMIFRTVPHGAVFSLFAEDEV